MTTRANLFPLLINARGHASRHEFVGTKYIMNDGVVESLYPMFRCTETGEDRVFGHLTSVPDLRELYGTGRAYR